MKKLTGQINFCSAKNWMGLEAFGVFSGGVGAMAEIKSTEGKWPLIWLLIKIWYHDIFGTQFFKKLKGIRKENRLVFNTAGYTIHYYAIRNLGWWLKRYGVDDLYFGDSQDITFEEYCWSREEDYKPESDRSKMEFDEWLVAQHIRFLGK